MDLKKIFATIQSQIKDNSFLLSQSTTGIEGFNRLCSVFSLDTI